MVTEQNERLTRLVRTLLDMSELQSVARNDKIELHSLIEEVLTDLEPLGIPVTYAGGVGSFADLQELKKLGRDHIDVTIGSALDLFGGSMPYREVLRVCAANLDENS